MSHESIFGLSLHAYLAGAWHIERHIDDRRAETAMRFTGEARFEAVDAAIFLYTEKGQLQNGPQTLQASQSHRWLFHGKGADVSFLDGRAFHNVLPRNGQAKAVHDCTPDRYIVQYAFETPNQWSQQWTATGPCKNYILESMFTRLHPPSVPVQSPRE